MESCNQRSSMGKLDEYKFIRPPRLILPLTNTKIDKSPPNIVFEANSTTGNCCTKFCLQKFDDIFKFRLKLSLSKMKKKEKKIYMFDLLSINEEKKRRAKSLNSLNYFQYSVKHYGVLQRVCKLAFIVLHDTTPRRVLDLCLKLRRNSLLSIENYEEEIITSRIKLHFFESFDSSNIFKSIKDQLSDANMNNMWLDFKEKYGNDVSLKKYKKTVMAKFAISVTDEEQWNKTN